MLVKVGFLMRGVIRALSSFFDNYSFVAAYPALDDTQNVAEEGTIMNLMPKGQGTATSTHAAPILFPDADGVYWSADVDEPAWNGARVDLDSDKLFWSGLGVTAATPTPIVNMRALFSDGSTHREKYSDGYIGDSVASGVNATYRPADGESVDIYLGSSVNLTQFRCETNQLTGSIPDLSSNVNLIYFYCYSNQLTGSIPNLSSNVNLIQFYCQSNQLTGSIPALSSNVNLSIFYCYSNQLTGSIPNLSNNVNLTHFFCHFNQLTGSIPNLYNNVNLTVFSCYSNQLTGSIPDLSSNVNLTVFICHSNQLTGSIPNLSSNVNLNNFNCYSNQLTGSIPNLSNNVNLTQFSCNTNQLTGSIPDLSSNVNLIYFYCQANQLTGSIPDLSSNVNLVQFQCYSNQLTGSIPDLSSNVNLANFFCYFNQLTGYSGGWPAKAFNFNAYGNALTEAAVNLILTEADTYGIATGTTISLAGGTNAVPTGAGLTAKANLIANGATVTTNV